MTVNPFSSSTTSKYLRRFPGSAGCRRLLTRFRKLSVGTGIVASFRIGHRRILTLKGIEGELGLTDQSSLINEAKTECCRGSSDVRGTRGFKIKNAYGVDPIGNELQITKTLLGFGLGCAREVRDQVDRKLIPAARASSRKRMFCSRSADLWTSLRTLVTIDSNPMTRWSQPEDDMSANRP